MWCLHPHGMLMFSFILNGATRIYAGDEAHYLPGLVQGKGWRATGVAEPLLWKLPFIRSFLQLMGCAEPAGRESFKDLLRRRIPFGILPGGSEEIILLTRGKERIYIKHRKGFIKYALEQGYWLIPGYAFGESDTYWTPPKPMLQGFRLWLLRATKLIWPLTFGYWSPYIPLPVALDTVWGKPVKLPKIPEPTAAEVDKWHAVYIEAIKGVFERNKARFNCTDRELEIL